MITFFIFLFSPVGSFFICLYQFCLRKYKYLLGIGVCLALWSTYVPPIGDQSRYFQMIRYGDGDFNDVSHYTIIRVLCNLFYAYNFPLEILRFLLVFVAWYVLYLVVKDIMQKYSKEHVLKSDFFYLQVIILSCFPWVGIAYGFRWGTACCFAISSIYFLLVVKKYIERCARSLFKKITDSIELLFVDDSSPDSCIAVM